MSSVRGQRFPGAMLTLGVEIEGLANRVIGAAIEVHRALGPGYLESVYEESMAIEMANQGISFVRQKPVGVCYKGHPVGESQLDFLIADKIVLELKAVERLAPVHTAQVISYLKASNLRLGLLMNFNMTMLKDGLERIIL